MPSSVSRLAAPTSPRSMRWKNSRPLSDSRTWRIFGVGLVSLMEDPIAAAADANRNLSGGQLVAQDAIENLADGAHRQRVSHFDGARYLVLGQIGLAVREQFVLGHRHILSQHDA